MENEPPKGKLDTDTLCPICANISSTRDKGTCPHSTAEQDKFAAERKERLRRTRLGHREKYNGEENQKVVRGWAAGLEKRKEVRG
mgnify:CR=1 FL=1